MSECIFKIHPTELEKRLLFSTCVCVSICAAACEYLCALIWIRWVLAGWFLWLTAVQMVYSCLLRRELTLNIYNEASARPLAAVLWSPVPETRGPPSHPQATDRTLASCPVLLIQCKSTSVIRCAFVGLHISEMRQVLLPSNHLHVSSSSSPYTLTQCWDMPSVEASSRGT